MQRDYDAASRLRLKRALARQAGASVTISRSRPGMVEMEFDTIWAQHEAEKEGRKRMAAGQADANSGAAEGPVDAAALIAPEETALEGGRTNRPRAPRPDSRTSTNTSRRRTRPPRIPGRSTEPLDAAALIAPEETALEGASDSEPAARKRMRRS